MADIEDDEAPPELVDVSEQPISSTPTTTLDTPAQNRVPITLVTGRTSSEKKKKGCMLTENRLSWCRKDYIAELYPHGETWQKDCRDYEWFV